MCAGTRGVLLPPQDCCAGTMMLQVQTSKTSVRENTST